MTDLNSTCSHTALILASRHGKTTSDAPVDGDSPNPWIVKGNASARPEYHLVCFAVAIPLNRRPVRGHALSASRHHGAFSKSVASLSRKSASSTVASHLRTLALCAIRTRGARSRQAEIRSRNLGRRDLGRFDLLVERAQFSQIRKRPFQTSRRRGTATLPIGPCLLNCRLDLFAAQRRRILNDLRDGLPRGRPPHPCAPECWCHERVWPQPAGTASLPVQADAVHYGRYAAVERE